VSPVSTSSPEPIASPGSLEHLADRFAVEAHQLRPAWAHEQIGSVGPARYVEVLGLVSRLVAVDTFVVALGQQPVEIPDAVPGSPTGDIDESATIDGGWVPTVGQAWPPTALSLVPAELDGMLTIHDAFYLSMEQMADNDISRGLHRTEMELIAARTSLLNECFF
jgi:hypothetical protein